MKTQQVLVASIKVENRQRQDMGDIDTLALNIKEVGLLQPIGIDTNDKLVWGGRRLAAVKKLEHEKVYAIRVGEDITGQSELIENIFRKDFTWQEKCKAIAEFHSKAEAKLQLWTIQDTSRVLGIKNADVSNYIKLYERLEEKEIKDCTSFATAVTAVTRHDKRGTFTDLSTLDDTGATADEKLDALDTSEMTAEEVAEVKQLDTKFPGKNGDFIEFQKAYKGKPYNCWHVDFPWGVEIDKGHVKREGVGSYDDSPEVFFALMDALEAGMKNMVAEKATMLFWFGWRHFDYTRERLEGMGWRLSRPIIWTKGNVGVVPDRFKDFKYNYEMSFLCLRGDTSILSSINASAEFPLAGHTTHVTEKPVAMLNHFLRGICDTHSSFFDPTFGSGNSLTVARTLGAHRIGGIEMDEEYFNIAKERWETE